MGSKKFVWTITSVVGGLCLFFLTFPFVSRNVQRQAVVYATSEKGEMDLKKKQAFLDSLWDKPAFNILLVVVILLFFEGEVLRGFSFSLLVGVIFGTCSSIFIAAPVILDFYSNKVGKPVPKVHGKELATA